MIIILNGESGHKVQMDMKQLMVQNCWYVLESLLFDKHKTYNHSNIQIKVYST
jgi:hypothetical protein